MKSVMISLAQMDFSKISPCFTQGSETHTWSTVLSVWW